MIGRTNAGGGGSGCTLTVTAPVGSTVTISKDGKTKTKATDSSGVAVFKGLSGGEWTVIADDGERTATKKVTITTDYATLISFNTIPEFTYTGDYEIVNDSDEPITTSQGNWKIRFLTSGTLTFTTLNGADNGIDVFLVGGGGSSTSSFRGSPAGAGGGYTKTVKSVSVASDTQYAISVGSGAKPGEGVVGGTSEAFGATADGGVGTTSQNVGGNGGSGGAGYSSGSKGGSDGSNGSGTSSGKGQGTTTREFGEENGRLYAGGGGGYQGTGGAGGGGNVNRKGVENTGGGAGGNSTNPTTGGYSGGSGIVIIRNARGVA